MSTLTRDARDLARVEAWTEQLMRLRDFHKWLDSNVLFPTVPDSIVNPIRSHVIDAEHILVNKLYDYGDIDRVVIVDKTLTATKR